jgi:hypothetical protein
MPMAGHSLVKAWCARGWEEKGSNSGTSASESGRGSRRYKKRDRGKSGGGIADVDMGAAAAHALSDTGLDFKAFGDALARIQIHHNETVAHVGRC